MFCFIIDTNPSMNDVTDTMSGLDMCKCAVEQFVLKFRAMGMQSVLDKSFMLLKSGQRASNFINICMT